MLSGNPDVIPMSSWCRMSKKTFFAVLGLFVFLCVLCSGLGILRTVLDGETKASIPPNLEGMLSQRLGDGDVDSAQPSKCREQLRQGTFVLAEGERCRFTIQSSSLPVRELPLLSPKVTRSE